MSHDPDTLRVALRRLVARLAGRARLATADGDDLFDGAVLRSMNVLELVTHIEDAYAITLTQRDVAAGRLRTIDKMVELVVSRAGGRS